MDETQKPGTACATSVLIQQVDNGFAAEYWSGWDDDAKERAVFEEITTDGIENESVASLYRLLWWLIDKFPPDGDSRYAKERVRVRIEPGDKHEEGET